MDHRQDYPEPFFCKNRIQGLCRHEDHLALVKDIRRIINRDLCALPSTLDVSIEGGGMFG
jgi:hypothetical protein